MQNQGKEDIISSIYRYGVAGHETEVMLNVASYKNNGTLAVQLMCRQKYSERAKTSLFEEPYVLVTINLPESERLAANEQFVDTSSLPNIAEWLIENKIAEPTKHFEQSTYCTYQAFAFRLPEKIMKNIIASRGKTHCRTSSECD